MHWWRQRRRCLRSLAGRHKLTLLLNPQVPGPQPLLRFPPARLTQPLGSLTPLLDGPGMNWLSHSVNLRQVRLETWILLQMPG